MKEKDSQILGLFGIGLNIMSVSFRYNTQKSQPKLREKEESLQKKLQVAQTRFQQNPREEFEEILNKCKLEQQKFSTRKPMD